MKRGAGFTLLEMLVALVVLGLVILGATQGIRLGIAGWTAQSRLIQQTAPLIGVDRFLRELIQGIEISASDKVRGTSHEFTFVGRLPDAIPGPQDLALITLIATRDHRFVLRWRPEPHVGGLPLAAAQEAELLNDVAAVDFSYVDLATRRGGGWQNAVAGVVPRLIKIKIVGMKNGMNRWPAIIVAPVVSPRRP